MKGFSLIEIMIVVAIITLLATLAYPSYQENLYKTRRSDGHIALLNLATSLEAYYLNHHTYLGAQSPEHLGQASTSEQGYYHLSITTPSAQSYLLMASPSPDSPQQHDPCGKLTLNHEHEKGADAPNCW